MDYSGAKAFITKKLEKELDPKLTYHSLDHTMDVLESVTRLIEMEKIDDHTGILIKTAALYHDAGFIRIYDGHEKISIELAKNTLPAFGYSEKDIARIEELILATELDVVPGDPAGKILADADLDYVGRDDFFMVALKLHYEWRNHGNNIALRDWYKLQLDFLKDHRFFTKSAYEMRQNQKTENLREIENLLDNHSE